MDTALFPVLGLTLVACVVVVVVSLRAAAKRRAAMRAWAAQRGWTYLDRDNSMHRRFKAPVFRTGTGRRSTEVAVGEFAGRTCATFRYTYEIRSGKTTKTFEFHCVTAQLLRPMPALQLTPEGFGSKLATRLGAQDIRFEWEAFNNAWRVQSESKELAFDVVHQQFMELLMTEPFQGMGIRFEGAEVVTWLPGIPRIEAIDERIHQIIAVVDSVRPYVWNRLAGS